MTHENLLQINFNVLLKSCRFVVNGNFFVPFYDQLFSIDVTVTHEFINVHFSRLTYFLKNLFANLSFKFEKIFVALILVQFAEILEEPL